ncbi:MAG: leucine-rich repeat protein [Clostridia bacterium]|nr:leucine-rich repeat protein [Clostridia bacterium]
MKMTKDQKAITLIALVITIIVLLILAGVALATLTGNTSIIDNANYAVTEYNKSANGDQNVLNQVEELFARYMGNGNNEQTAAIQAQYGDLVDPSKDKINQELFTYETYEPGETIGLVRHVSGENKTGGMVSRGDTPSAQEKGSAKITGINWEYFSDEYFDEGDSVVSGSSGLYERDLTVTSAEKKQQVEQALKKLIIPAEIEKNGKKYVVKEVELTETLKFSSYDGEEGDYMPFLATTDFYAEAGATSSNATYLIIPACVEKIDNCIYLPRDYVLFAPNSKVKEVSFHGNEFIQGVSLPENLTGENVIYFSGCKNLKSIKIPNGITRLGYQTFASCSSLETVEMGAGIVEIDTFVFAACDSLKNIVLNDNLKNVNENAFTGCNGLKTMTIPGGIRSLGAELFEYCDELEMESITYNNVVYTKIADLIAALKANNVTFVETEQTTLPYDKPTFQGVLLSGDR